MKHYTIHADNGNRINFCAHNGERAEKKAERIAMQNKIFGYELKRREF